MTLKERVEQVVRDDIAPIFAMDDTQLKVTRIEGETVHVRIQGACTSCPSSVMNIIMGREQELRRLVPEIDFVEIERD